MLEIEELVESLFVTVRHPFPSIGTRQIPEPDQGWRLERSTLTSSRFEGNGYSWGMGEALDWHDRGVKCIFGKEASYILKTLDRL